MTREVAKEWLLFIFGVLLLTIGGGITRGRSVPFGLGAIAIVMVSAHRRTRADQRSKPIGADNGV